MGKPALVNPNGQEMAKEPTDIITIMINMEDKDASCIVTPGIANNPLEAANILFSMGMMMLKNVKPDRKIKTKVSIPVVPLKELLDKIKQDTSKGRI